MIGEFANSSNLLRTVWSTAPYFVGVQPLMANLSYGVWVVDTSHATHDPIFVDVDGDGLKDAVIPQYFRNTGRELHIYLQETNERFSNSPLKIEIKSEAIGFALMDVRESPGTEIIWITADAIYSFSASIQGYVGNLEHYGGLGALHPSPGFERTSLCRVNRHEQRRCTRSHTARTRSLWSFSKLKRK